MYLSLNGWTWASHRLLDLLTYDPSYVLSYVVKASFNRSSTIWTYFRLKDWNKWNALWEHNALLLNLSILPNGSHIIFVVEYWYKTLHNTGSVVLSLYIRLIPFKPFCFHYVLLDSLKYVSIHPPLQYINYYIEHPPTNEERWES